MLPGILGTKVGMTHVFTEDGKMLPVTVIQAGPVYVTQVKTSEKDGYTAVQVGYGEASKGQCGSGAPGPGVWRCRSVPAERHIGLVGVTFCDGHSKAMKLSAMDDYDRDGNIDNGYWNGVADPLVR